MKRIVFLIMTNFWSCTAIAETYVVSKEAKKLRLPCPILSLLWLEHCRVWKTPRDNITSCSIHG